MRSVIAMLLVCLAFQRAATQGPPVQFSNPSPSDWVHIDGAKNPELIPEWSVWKQAFAMFQRIGELPTAVVKAMSREEAQTVLDAAAEHQKNVALCEQRVLKLKPLLNKEPAAEINRRTEAINLECRWQTLRLRDRVVDGLQPDGQVALRQWVESTKAGIRVSVPKRELDFYLKPK